MSPRYSHPNINTLWSEIIAEELARCGVRDVVISPGSRSTPLVLACAQHPDLADHSVLDERAAAFFALGIARASRRPVALLCTSGTAAANYYPAVCEADAAGVPLLLFTADRPAYLRHSGAPQTMDHVKLYGERVRQYVDLAQPEADDTRLRALRAAVCHAVAMCGAPAPGPVHCNVPFRKPLEPLPAARVQDRVEDEFIAEGAEGISGRRSGRAWTEFLPTADALASVADALLRAKRPVIIAGPDAEGDEYADALCGLAAAQDIPVLAEAASQLRFRAEAAVIGSADLLLRSEAFRTHFHPDCIVRVGGTATNAGMLRFLEEADAADTILIAADRRRRDPAHRVSMHVHGDPALFLADLRTLLAARPLRDRHAWSALFTDADAAARTALDAALASNESGLEGAFIAELGKLLPEGTPLMVSSSMPIRDVETFLPALPNNIPVFFNRGVNGIDGVVSTALGMVRGSRRRGTLLIGDVAFLHNLNATVGGGLASLPLTIVLLNNNGGEIFELLPVREYDPAFTRHFLTPPDCDIAAVARALGLPVRTVTARDDFAKAFHEASADEGCTLIEIRSDIDESGRLRRSVMSAVATEVDAALSDFRSTDDAALSDFRSTDDAELSDFHSTGGEDASDWPLAVRMLREGESVPVLLLHGFTRSGSSWERIAAHWEGRPVFALDLMGHGRSPAPEAQSDFSAYTLESAAAGIEAFCERCGFSSIHLVGYSLGGRTALTYAASYPDRVRTLALLSAHPGIEDETEREARRESDAALADRIVADGLDAFVTAWSATPMFAAQCEADPLRWQRVVDDRLSQRAHGMAASLRGSGQGSQRPLWEALNAFTFPVLIAAGEKDARYAAMAERLRQQQPAAVVEVFAGAGHDLLFDRETELAGMLRELWKRA